MQKKLPEKLKKEPLIDAIFELRFTSEQEVAEVLPGIFFSQIDDGSKSFVSLPAAQLPKALRNSDPSLIFAPTTQMVWNNFFLNMSDRSVSINCKLPYPGWKLFKDTIIKSLKIVFDSKLIKHIERCSVKYINLLETPNIIDQINYLNFSCQLAGENIDSQPFTFKIEKKINNTVNIIQLVSSAKFAMPNQPFKEGLVIDIDTIINMENDSMSIFMDVLDQTLESLHDTNKKIFFSLLKDDVISMLEPVYE